MSKDFEKDILIIQPTYGVSDYNPLVDWKKDLDSHSKTIPIGLTHLASELKAQNLSVDIFDTRFYSRPEIVELLNAKIPQYKYIAFSVITEHVAHALEMCKQIRECSSQPIIWGGVHPTLFSEQTISHPLVDYVLKGEAETSFIKLINLLDSGDITPENLTTIDGIYFKHNGEIINNPNFPIISDINTLANPDYTVLEIEKYVEQQLVDDRIVRSMAVISSRGCPYKCTFCLTSEFFPRSWRPWDSEQVLNFLEEIINTYKLNDIAFFDDFFFGTRKRSIEIVQGMIDRKLNVSWTAKLRASSISDKFVDDELLALMRKSGCYCLQMGFESGSPRMLKIYNKRITIENIKNAVEKCKKHDIMLDASWLMAAPGETVDEIKETFKLIGDLVKLDPHFIPRSPGAFRPYPGSALYDETLKAGFKEPTTLDEWCDFKGVSGIISKEQMPWFKNHDFIRDLRVYGLLLQAFYKNQLPDGPFNCVHLLKHLILFRYRHKIWFFRIEARAFNFAQKVISNFPKSRLYKYVDKV